MAIINSAMRGVPVVMQPAGSTTGNGTAFAIPQSFHEHHFDITGSAGISAGAIQIESSNDGSYSGTWEAQGSPITAVASAKKSTNISGNYPFLRARISTDIVGGTVEVDYTGS